MTRTNKWTVHEKAAEPRYFSHNGNYGEAPAHIKKGGSGKGGWGKFGDEMNDLIESGEIPAIFNKKRRPSNINSQINAKKFEEIQNYQG